MARNLYTVLEQILPFISGSEPDLISQFKSLMSSVEYAAPENQAMWWIEVADWLGNTFKDPENLPHWAKEFVDIWMDK